LLWAQNRIGLLSRIKKVLVELFPRDYADYAAFSDYNGQFIAKRLFTGV
jgi:hypothetical protein